MEETITATPTTMEQPTAVLRWSKAGKLQQQWRIIEYRNGDAVAEKGEWRDVPAEAN